jgi:hypothetical protein
MKLTPQDMVELASLEEGMWIAESRYDEAFQAQRFADDCVSRRRTGGAILLGGHAAREMRAGPSKPVYRRRLQTTHCCCV